MENIENNIRDNIKEKIKLNIGSNPDGNIEWGVRWYFWNNVGRDILNNIILNTYSTINRILKDEEY